MTPKEKAELIINKLSNSSNVFYKPKIGDSIGLAIECCNIVLDAVSTANYGLDYLQQRDYWMDVRIILEDMQNELINP
jgi:hypothetical protein